MKVWIDQDLCTGDGLCTEIAPDVFVLLQDGLAYVQENGVVCTSSNGDMGGPEALSEVPEHLFNEVIDASEECPGECIFVEQ